MVEDRISQADVEARKLQRQAEVAKAAEERPDMTTEEAMSRAERKAVLAQLLDRGLVNARLEVKDADPNFYYMWAREDDTDLQRLFSLGFELVPKTSEKEAEHLHGTADNLRRLGDVVCVRTPKENHELIEEVKTERKAARALMGKREYLRQAKKHGVPILDPLGVSKEIED
jgi:hypothetical protein